MKYVFRDFMCFCMYWYVFLGAAMHFSMKNSMYLNALVFVYVCIFGYFVYICRYLSK